MYEDIETKIIELVAKRANMPGVTRDKSLMDDLRMDALDIVETLMDAETEFGVRITEEVADRVRTVGDIVEAVARAKKNAGKGNEQHL